MRRDPWTGKVSLPENMLQKTIVCEQGDEAYDVTLTGKKLSIFTDTIENPDVKNKKGEARVDAILAAGGVSEIERRRNGELTDGENGKASVQQFYDDGTLASTKNHNSDTGEDVVRIFTKKSVLKRVERYKNGKLNDGKNGEPAHQLFTDSGNRVLEEHYKNGKPNDGKNGEPAYQDFDAYDMPLNVKRYKDGKLTEVLSGPALTDYLESYKKDRTPRVRVDRKDHATPRARSNLLLQHPIIR